MDKGETNQLRRARRHHIDWHSTFLDENGVLQVFDTQSQIEVVAGAPSYDGQVLLRLFSNWASLPNGDVDFDIQAINPTQRASFYLVSTFFRGTPNAETDVLEKTRRKLRSASAPRRPRSPTPESYSPGRTRPVS